jgi:transcriptional regulator with XRE-family HTH domain
MSPSLRRVRLSQAVARAIRAERARRGISQIELAATLNWSREKLSAIESGRQRIATDLAIICRVFNLPLSSLVPELDDDDRQALGL